MAPAAAASPPPPRRRLSFRAHSLGHARVPALLPFCLRAVATAAGVASGCCRVLGTTCYACGRSRGHSRLSFRAHSFGCDRGCDGLCGTAVQHFAGAWEKVSFADPDAGPVCLSGHHKGWPMPKPSHTDDCGCAHTSLREMVGVLYELWGCGRGRLPAPLKWKTNTSMTKIILPWIFIY